MRTVRIELEGSAGHAAIERRRGSATIRIESILSNPRGEDAIMTWEVAAGIESDELFRIAEVLQRRCAGVKGTNSDIHDYFRELQRFQY